LPGLERLPGWGLISRFAAAGVVNTALGLAVIVGLDVGLGVRPALANAAGYATGIAASWLLQRRFVFRTDQAGWATKARFLATMAAAFGLNQAVLWLLARGLGDEPERRLVAQLIAVATYSTVQFLLLNGWVFRSAPRAGADQPSSRRIP
jgi:putative flippase GtrA